jgi:hypothetical protein
MYELLLCPLRTALVRVGIHLKVPFEGLALLFHFTQLPVCIALLSSFELTTQSRFL